MTLLFRISIRNSAHEMKCQEIIHVAKISDLKIVFVLKLNSFTI